MTIQIRHGDVLMTPVDTVIDRHPHAGTTEAILAYGEVTGHAHRLRGADVRMWGEDGQAYVRVGGAGALLSHEEHMLTRERLDAAMDADAAVAEAVRLLAPQPNADGRYPIPVPPGTYQVTIQRVYTPWGERRVRD